MATANPAPVVISTPAEAAEGDQCVVLRNIGWRGYKTMLRLRGDRPRPKFIYLDGNLSLVTPELPHERLSRRMGIFVDQVILGLRLPCFHCGQTTFRWKSKRGGVEGDHTYYFANEALVRGKMKIDLRVDPPPDLAIEVVYTHKADDALKVYRRLKVPEIWACDEVRLRILVRRADGKYVESSTSMAIPGLMGSDILGWMSRPYEGPDLDWMEDVRRWVKEVLVPRIQRREG